MTPLTDKLRELPAKLQQEKLDQFKRRASFRRCGDRPLAECARVWIWRGHIVLRQCLDPGDVRVGSNTWIGPTCILDGTGGTLLIGDYYSISAGVQIYTHEALIFTPYLIHGLAFNQNDRKTRMALELRFNIEQEKPRR